MDRGHLNILKLELHEVKTKADQAGVELECRKLFIDALDSAINGLENVRDLELKLKREQDARAIDAELLESWKLEDRVKTTQLTELKKENTALRQELKQCLNRSQSTDV